MSKKKKTYRGKSRLRKYNNGCNCFHCLGDREKRHEVHHLQKIKNNNWLNDVE
jgi:hypothetical protein